MAYGEAQAPIPELVTPLLEKLYTSFYRGREPTFRRLDSMSLDDGQKFEVEVYSTNVVVRLEGRVIRTPLIALSYAKGNRTLLGIDFLQKSGIVLNLNHRNWLFIDSPH
ncbi:hypothetical protein NPIL_295491 [Nephila pilipes]|uniref:Uncharacterized protein n=1 Tax=Nephila pilipes TaxID=299642 RepID=A0A8X6QYP0_NEPPI|nr:hypothetical protein NPIL_295491 [Nephila pilipes]